MDFEAMLLYNKIILGPVTPTYDERTRVAETEKWALAPIKNIRVVTGTVKKKMTEHVCPRSTCLAQKVLRTSELCGIEADGLTVNENIWRPSGMDITPRWSAGIHSLSSVISLRVSSMERARRFAVRQRLVEEIYIAGWRQARGRKISPIKDGDPHRNGDLCSTSQKWLIVNENLQSCECQSFNILVNCSVQFFIFPQNLTFANTFFVFLISVSDSIFYRSGDPISINKNTYCKVT